MVYRFYIYNEKTIFILKWFYVVLFWILIYSFLNEISINEHSFYYSILLSFLYNYTDDSCDVGYSISNLSINYNFDNIFLWESYILKMNNQPGSPENGGQQPRGPQPGGPQPGGPQFGGPQPGGPQPGGHPGGQIGENQPQEGGPVDRDEILRQSIFKKLAERRSSEFRSIFENSNVFSRTIYPECNFTEEEKIFIVNKANTIYVRTTWQETVYRLNSEDLEEDDQLLRRVPNKKYFVPVTNKKQELDYIYRWMSTYPKGR